jgi:hypothetical protein
MHRHRAPAKMTRLGPTITCVASMHKGVTALCCGGGAMGMRRQIACRAGPRWSLAG